MSVQRRLRQAGIGLLIAGLHLAGVMVWWATGYSMKLPLARPQLPAVSVSLAPPSVPDIEQPPLRRPLRAQNPEQATQPRSDDRPAASIATGAAEASPVATPPGEDAPAPTQTPSPLNLNLSRKDILSAAPRSFAEQSPFRGRLPKTVERQIAAAAAESGPWVEERLDNDRIRFRRGNTCMTAQRPRAASIDPFSEAAGRIPWRMTKPEECTD